MSSWVASCGLPYKKGQGRDLDKDDMKFCGVGKKTLNKTHMS